jgi:ABC-type antimicrobial peptide transport system permease subunit
MLALEGAPLWQPPRFMSVAVRTRDDDPARLTLAIRRLVASLDPEVPVANVRTMEAVVATSMARTSFTTLMLAVAAAMALVVSAVGLYGVVAYLVAQRRGEIGVRMALGARQEQVVRHVVGDAMRLTRTSLILGSLAAYATARTLQVFFHGMRPWDPALYAAVAVLLTAVALLASWIPARRAAAVDPMVAIRAS